MTDYIHEVHYYETDQMGITHHSNYIRWMEEARTYFLEKIGFGYKSMEETGIISPVLSVNGEYKRSTTYGDKVSIHVWIKENKGVKIKIGYKITNIATNEVCFIGESVHGFLKKTGTPISIKKDMVEFYEALKKYEEEL